MATHWVIRMLDPSVQKYMMPILVACAFACVVFAVLYPYVSGDRKRDKRLESVTGNRPRKGVGGSAGDAQNSRRKSVADSLKDIEDRQKAKEKVTMRMRLVRAGVSISPRDFYIMSAIAGVVAAGLALVSFDIPLPGAAVVGFIAAAGLPRWILKKKTAKRQQKFVAELANGIDIIVRGVKSGLPLNECVQILAKESPEPLASEFKEVVEQQRLGVPLGEGLDRLCDRIPLPEVRFLAIVVAIQQQAGGNLSEALGNLSGVLRDRVSLQMKVKALSAEAKASAGVLACLPPGVMFMVYVSSPNYIMPLFTTTTGNFMVACGAIWMTMGVLIMRKMINFKF
jgi:tight adherence protein B